MQFYKEKNRFFNIKFATLDFFQDFLLHKIDPRHITSLFINFSGQTTANITQDIIMQKLDKRKKGVYGPQVGKQFVLFVDDVSMPTKEEYGAQPPIEILRQLLDMKAWYDLKEIIPQKLVDIQVSAQNFNVKSVVNRFFFRLCVH